MRHSSAVISAEEVQAGVRTHDITINLLHHLRILHDGSHAFSTRQSWIVRGASGGQNMSAEGDLTITQPFCTNELCLTISAAVHQQAKSQ